MVESASKRYLIPLVLWLFLLVNVFTPNMLNDCAKLPKVSTAEAFVKVNKPEVSVTTNSAILDVMMDKLKVNTNKTQHYFAAMRRSYGNRADFDSAERLFGFVKELHLNNPESVVLLGGTNDGQLSSTILKWCPEVSFYGFEIQHVHFQKAKELLKPFPHARVINVGWDESKRENVPIGGRGVLGGLFDPRGQRGWQLQDKTVNTIAMADFAVQENIEKTLYVVIDTEGHEPKVIRGMRLNQEENQKRFPLFQYELGGTWAAKDNRHGNDPWTQKDTAKHLEHFGYLLFLTGEVDWLAVTSDFFDETNNPGMQNERFGPFIQGNLLAMHAKFTPSSLLNKILEHAHVEQ